MEDVQNNPGKELEKQSDKFNQNLSKLSALMKGKIAPSKKLGNNVALEVVDELLKERQETFQIDFKASLSNLIEKKIKLDQEFELKRKELEKLQLEKYKEFNQAANNLFNKIEDINKLEQDFIKSMKEIETAVSGEESTNEK